MACWLYEGILMFGVVFIAGYLFGTLSQTRNALDNRHPLQAFLFVVFGIYFVWFWAKGQTLAMKTWHIRVVDAAGQPLTQVRALGRYLLAWMWFMPALLTLNYTGLKGGAPTFAALAAGVLGYAALAWLHPDRQYWHDAMCRTRLVDWQPPRRHP